MKYALSLEARCAYQSASTKSEKHSRNKVKNYAIIEIPFFLLSKYYLVVVIVLFVSSRLSACTLKANK